MKQLLDKIYNSGKSELIENSHITNYFDIYGVSGKLFFSKEEIEEIYYFFSKFIHPDKFSNGEKSQLELSLTYFELLNNGLKTFKNDFEKANYWLELEKNRVKDKKVPGEILADIFEIQELLQEEELSDSAEEELEEYLETFENLQKSLKKNLNNIFEKHDKNELNKEETAQKLNEILNKSTYTSKLIEQIEEKLG
jgi:DnaJ-domain-containing protein 1